MDTIVPSEKGVYCKRKEFADIYFALYEYF